MFRRAGIGARTLASFLRLPSGANLFRVELHLLLSAAFHGAVLQLLRAGWWFADLEPDLPAIRNFGNLPMQIPAERHLFIQVGDVGVVGDICAFSKNNGRFKTDTLQIVR